MESPTKKSRNTRQRSLILDILRSRHDHPTAEEIYREARKTLPQISLGTVYRNLSVLRGHGLAREFRPSGEPSSRFDGNCRPHAHFYCTGCRALTDLPLPDALRHLSWDGAEIGSISMMELQLAGLCARCTPPALRVH
ncbi:MAG: transcriptional repressor [Deltaproteobacteria bacterium]